MIPAGPLAVGPGKAVVEVNPIVGHAEFAQLHGYDKTVPLTVGSPAAVAFVADLPGVFEVDTHDSGLLLFQLMLRG